MKLLNWLKYFVILLIGFLTPLSAVTQQSEYTIKAVFLEHFTRFIEWPESSDTADPSSPFYVAVIGENPFGSILDEIYSDQMIKKRKVKILYISTPDEIADCHMLFISSSNKEILPEILSCTSIKPILTVSDTNGFAEKGVLINFYLAGDKIKFEINEKAVHESGLVMSYRLLSLARIVNQGRGRE
ncbi:YfiR family protein [Acidobacteriota bacterium]